MWSDAYKHTYTSQDTQKHIQSPYNTFTLSMSKQYPEYSLLLWSQYQYMLMRVFRNQKRDKTSLLVSPPSMQISNQASKNTNNPILSHFKVI